MANAEADANTHNGWSPESTKPTIKPVIMELSVTRKDFVLRNRMADSSAEAEITAASAETRNAASLSLIDRKRTKQTKKRINRLLMDFNLIASRC